MTCFSIHKSFRFAFAAILTLGILASSGAFAQVEPPAEEVAKIKAKDDAEAMAKEGKIDAPIVIELFTASDCTACIFADRMLYDAMKDKNVIALSCHIQDFNDESLPEDKRERKQKKKDEDYIGDGGDDTDQGPMDPCVFRQWAYSSSNRGDDVTVNIPTFYINGLENLDGSDLNYFTATINSYHYRHKNKVLEAMMRWKDKDTISIHLPQNNQKGERPNASVWLVRYKDMEVQRMDEGINKGRVLRFSNVIQSIVHVGKWHGDMRTIDVDVTPPTGGKDHGGYAVVVSTFLGDPYLAAGSLVDYPVASDLKEAAERRAKAKAANADKLIAVPSDKVPVEAPLVQPRH